jgi:hypothetical protein
MTTRSSNLGRSILSALAGLVLTLASGPLFAQGAGGSITGKVTDPTGAAMSGVKVSVASPTTGLGRTQTTEADGSYNFPGLPPGNYNVEFSASGFKTIDHRGVTVNVASTRTLDVKMEVAAVAEVITVSSEAPLLRSEPAISTVVSQQELKTLPLNGRQFANVAVLAPGTQLSYNSDPTKPGQLTVSLNGGTGRNVNYVIDGGDNRDDTIGGALQNFPLDSVQEFKIQTAEYKAEYGDSSGGVLNVVTKSGTNEFHGDAFEFFRDKSLNAETETEKQSGSGKSDYRRNQYGASLGGPIIKDKVHFFATGERTVRDTAYVVDTGGIFPGQDGKAIAIPFRDNLVQAKTTVDLSAAQYLQVRFGYQQNTDKYGASPTNTPDALGTISNKYSSVLASHQAQIGSHALNEFIFQWTKFSNSITPDSTHPALYFPSGVTSGENVLTPQSTRQTKYQFKDDFTYYADLFGQSHDIKFGINFVHEPQLEGDFSTGVDAPQYTFAGDNLASPIVEIIQYGGFNGQKTPLNEYDAYLQDDWRPSSRLTVNIGIRYDLYLGYDLNQSNNPILQTLATQTAYNDASYYGDFRGWNGKLTNDHTNWAPRVGFSYDLTGEAKTFAHGGWGIYYMFPYTNANILFPAGAVQSDYGVAYEVDDPNGIRNPDGSLFAIGDPLPPNQLPGANVPPPNEVARPDVTKTPFSRQLSFGISHQVGNWLGLALDFSNIQYRDLPFRFRGNPIDPATGARRFPDFGNFRIWTGGGKADYNGVTLSWNARITDKFRTQGFYTLSRITGNVLVGADEFRLTDASVQPDLSGGSKRDVSVNPLDPNCSACFGPLFTDARHKVTVGATYMAPLGINVSGVFRYRSPLPVDIYDGRDLNGDGFAIDLGTVAPHVNNGRGHATEQFDLSLARVFPIAGGVDFELIAQVFNVFNAKNPTGYRGNVYNSDGTPNPNFGKPTAYAGDPLQGEQRLLQIGGRLSF